MSDSGETDCREVIHPPELCPPPEPYSYAIKTGKTIYLAGQVALDSSGTIVGNTVTEQAEQVWSNILAVLREAGATAANIVKVVYYLADIRELDQEMVVRSRIFDGIALPAVTAVQVASLGLPGLVMEVDVTAELAE